MEKLRQSYPAQQQYEQYALPVTINQGKPTLNPPAFHGFTVMTGSGAQRNEADSGMQVIQGFFKSNCNASATSHPVSARPQGSIWDPNAKIHPAKIIGQKSAEECKETGLPAFGNADAFATPRQPSARPQGSIWDPNAKIHPAKIIGQKPAE